ncbi:methyltransferase domain-containing protein [Mariprofundus ferrooxydans]|nr:methyltransferase domain-containing protein [Mariprofundus ferrooxydans]
MGSDKFNLTWEESVQWLRDQEDQQELVKAAFYDDPLIDSVRRYADSSEWQAVLKVLPEAKGRVLDIGAGRGVSSYALARNGWQVTALEPDSSALVGAGAIRTLNELADLNIEIIETWGETLPFEDASFDLVYCRAVLHHANDLQLLCREVYRVLRPAGMFMATREHVISKKEDLPAFLDLHPLHHLYGGEHAYLLGEYRHAIEDSGMGIQHQFNPLASDMNLFPLTVAEIKQKIARKLHLPLFSIPMWLLRLIGAMDQTPGRLYSFVAVKK